MKFKFFLLCLGLTLTNTALFAQFKFSGTITDGSTTAPLVGVTIATASKGLATTNHQGKFSFEVAQKPRHFIISFIGFETLILAPEALQGNIQLKTSIAELNQIVISANRTEQKRLEVPAAIGVLSQKQIAAAKATQIDQLLNQMTGVYMSNLGNESHTMSIRSPLSYRALFLFTQDGLPIRPTGDFSHTALKEMDQASFQRIEVLRGPNSSIYGSEAIGGVINVITLTPTVHPSGKLSLQGNNIGYRRAEFNASNTFGNTGVFVGGHYGQSRDGWREHSNLDKVGTTFKLVQKLSTKTELTLTANYIYTSSETTGNLDSSNFFGRNLSSVHTFTHSLTEAFRSNAQFRHQWNSKSHSSLNIFYRHMNSGGIPHYRIRNDRNDPLKASGEIQSNGFQSYGAVFQHSQHFDWLDAHLLAGTSVDFSPANSHRQRISINRDTEGRYLSYEDLHEVFEDYNINYLNAAAFVQFDISPLKNLRLSGALRYDEFQYQYNSSEQLTLLAGIVQDNVSFHNLTPKIGATYNLGNNRGIYTNFSVGFVPPQIGNVYGADRVNRAIEPQVFNNYEIGSWFSFAQNKGYLDVALYSLEGKNELIRVVLADGSEEDRNVGRTSHRGVELTLKYQLTKALSWRLNGAYAEHKYEQFDTGSENYSGHMMERAPKWIWNTALDYRPAFFKGFRIGLEYQHLGEYFQSPTNNQTQVYPGFNLLHLRAGYAFGNQLKGLELWLNVLNLTNELYAEISDVSAYNDRQRYRPGNPRSITIGLQYAFGR